MEVARTYRKEPSTDMELASSYRKEPTNDMELASSFQREPTSDMQLADMISLLPAEVLYLIFCWLPPRDLKSVVLVCRLWREVGEAPGLWTWVVLRLTGEDTEVLGLGRLQAVRELRLRGEVGEEVMAAVVGHQAGRLVLEETDMRPVGPNILATAVHSLKQLTLREVKLTELQTEALFRAIPLGSNLKKLSLIDLNLSQVSPSLLARAVSLLEDLHLQAAQLTLQQAEAVFSTVCEGSQLRYLDMRLDSLALVSADLLARAANRLEQVALLETQLTRQQTQAVLAHSLVETCLRSLVIFPEAGGLERSLVEGAKLVIEICSV